MHHPVNVTDPQVFLTWWDDKEEWKYRAVAWADSATSSGRDEDKALHLGLGYAIEQCGFDAMGNESWALCEHGNGHPWGRLMSAILLGNVEMLESPRKKAKQGTPKRPRSRSIS